MNYDLIIIGGGASGLFCALTASARGLKVLVLEHNQFLGRKILISGGGNCNFSNLVIDDSHYYSQNKHFCKSALNRFSISVFTDLLDKYAIHYYEKNQGKLFCKESSQKVLMMLIQECGHNQVSIKTSCKVDQINKKDLFLVSTNLGKFSSTHLVIATGGLAYPQTGASDLGYKIAQQFGLAVVPTRPGLTQLFWNEKDCDKFSNLSGISLKASLTFQNEQFEDDLLFTHHGLSGPAVLQISNCWIKGQAIVINFIPGIHLNRKLKEKKVMHPRSIVKNFASQFLPRRLVDQIIPENLSRKKLNSLDAHDIEHLEKMLQKYAFVPKGVGDYSIAEVTVGGIDTQEISSKSFEAKKVAHLYFIGEVLDVTGQLGGYNLHWAWASGFCAGHEIGQ